MYASTSRGLEEDFGEEVKHDSDEEVEIKTSVAFKNVSAKLCEVIDNDVISDEKDGGLDGDDVDAQTQFIQSNDILESLVIGEKKEDTINTKIYGYMLAWNAMLSKLEEGRIKT